MRGAMELVASPSMAGSSRMRTSTSSMPLLAFSVWPTRDRWAKYNTHPTSHSPTSHLTNLSSLNLSSLSLSLTQPLTHPTSHSPNLSLTQPIPKTFLNLLSLPVLKTWTPSLALWLFQLSQPHSPLRSYCTHLTSHLPYQSLNQPMSKINLSLLNLPTTTFKVQNRWTSKAMLPYSTSTSKISLLLYSQNVPFELD